MKIRSLLVFLLIAVLPISAVAGEYIWLDPLQGQLTAPMEVGPEGDYVWVPGSGGGACSGNTFPRAQCGSIEFQVNLQIAGSYTVWGLVNFDSIGAQDSFWVSIDGGAPVLWDTQNGQADPWIWSNVTNRSIPGTPNTPELVVVYLSEGPHTLAFYVREQGAKLKRVLVTDDLEYVPTGDGPDTTPPGPPSFFIIILGETEKPTFAVTLAWDDNVERDLSGYKLYYKPTRGGHPYNGTGAEQGDSPIVIPLVDLADIQNPQFTVRLSRAFIWYFVVTAYDGPGNESAYSNEVHASALELAPEHRR